MNPDPFDHPCKETCSGWKQGYEKGLKKAEEQISELTEHVARLEKTLYYERDRAGQVKEDMLNRQAQVKRLEEEISKLTNEREK
jgi:peptidoglycan hydrolase CwlO-like protein